MKAAKACVLAINGGSSSIKFALYAAAESPVRLLSGKIERTGLPDAVLTVNESEKKPDTQSIEASDHGTAGTVLMNWLEQHLGFTSVTAIGHRVVHGGQNYREPQRVTSQLLEELR